MTMISNSPETAIKNIFERAATSLSNTRDQLDKTRRVLKKAILRLSTSTHSDDEQVIAILNDIRNAADTTINLSALDSQLDKLFVLTNNSAHQTNTGVQIKLYSSLKNQLDGINCSETCAAIINGFAEKKLSDEDISFEIIKLINEATQNRQ